MSSIDFQELLRLGREQLRTYQKIRSQFPIPFVYGEECPPICPWCKLGKRSWDGHIFTEDDLIPGIKDWCRFCIMTEIGLKNCTGIEPNLIGEHFNQILEMNNYVYTTASTNYPDVPYFGKNKMFLFFYAPKSLCQKITAHFGEGYQVVEETSGQNYIPNELVEQTKHLFEGDDPLIHLVLQDEIYERRTLYIVFNEFLKTI